MDDIYVDHKTQEIDGRVGVRSVCSAGDFDNFTGYYSKLKQNWNAALSHGEYHLKKAHN